MGYLALYRKYRPTKFSEVFGQEVVVEVLKNSIKNNSVSHAYLFSGPRGTGKTSIAKIFAKAVNCEFPEDGEACGKCNTCIEMATNDVDIIEIDAASNNGVDEIREIRNNVKLVPAVGKYKVYIIDEVHMLSMGAFNALLKTLEEPPEHVIFILATTEMHKIPLTIISRCQRFDFKKINSKDISILLNKILIDENKMVSEEVITLISESSDGGLRDAINLLDQSLNSCETPSIEYICSLSGGVLEKDIERLFDNIINKNISQSLDILREFCDCGKNLSIIIDKLVILVKNVNIYNNVNNYFDEITSKKLEKYYGLSNEVCIYLSKKLLELSTNIKKSSNQKIVFEIALLDIFNEFPSLEVESPPKYIKEENLIKNEENINQKTEDNKDEIISREIISIRINNSLAEANKELLKELKIKSICFSDFIANKKYNIAANILLKGELVVASEKYIMFIYKEVRELNLFLSNIELIEKFLSEIFENKYKTIAILNEEWKKIKEDYVQNKKNGIKYELQEEPKPKEKISKNKSVAFDIFGEDSIDIK